MATTRAWRQVREFKTVRVGQHDGLAVKVHQPDAKDESSENDQSIFSTVAFYGRTCKCRKTVKSHEKRNRPHSLYLSASTGK